MRQRTFWITIVMLVSMLLSACLTRPVMRQQFDTVDNHALKNKKGRWVATVPDCNNFVDSEFKPYDPKNLFGCYRAENLAYMIANPKDFEYPVRTRNHPGKPLSDAVENYRNSSGSQGGNGQ